MSLKKIILSVLAITFLAVSFVSCSPNSVADEDSLYNNHQGVDKTKIKQSDIPTNG